MKPIALALLLTLWTLPGFALEDTPAQREREAERYLLATPPQELMANITNQMAKTMPPEQRKSFQSLLALVDIQAVTKLMKQAMVKNFSADELKALADFYGSPVGKSAMKNYGTYMVDVMPGLQEELVKAFAKAQQNP
jgi:hypothetical protein